MAHFRLLLARSFWVNGTFQTTFGTFLLGQWHISDYFWHVHSGSMAHFRLLLARSFWVNGTFQTTFGTFLLGQWHISDYFWHVPSGSMAHFRLLLARSFWVNGTFQTTFDTFFQFGNHVYPRGQFVEADGSPRDLIDLFVNCCTLFGTE